jgi:hypothetical protein
MARVQTHSDEGKRARCGTRLAQQKPRRRGVAGTSSTRHA